MTKSDEQWDEEVDGALFRALLVRSAERPQPQPLRSWPPALTAADVIRPPQSVLMAAEAMRFETLLSEHESLVSWFQAGDEPWSDPHLFIEEASVTVEFIRPHRRVVLYTEAGWLDVDAFQMWMSGNELRWTMSSIEEQGQRDRLWLWLTHGDP